MATPTATDVERKVEKENTEGWESKRASREIGKLVKGSEDMRTHLRLLRFREDWPELLQLQCGVTPRVG